MSSPTDAAERLQNALRSADPSNAVFELARTLRDEGMLQLDLYFLFSDASVLTEDEALGEALTDTMDCIWGGGWGNGHDFYAQGLTGEIVNGARRARANGVTEIARGDS